MTHDDKYESEWIDVPPAGTSSLSDDALGRHLVRRGGGSAPRDLATSIAERVAATKPEPGWRRTARSLRPVAALAACLVVVLVGSLIAMAPRPGVDGGPGSTTFDPASRPLTVAELVRFYASGRAAGSVVIVDDDIAGLTISCPTVESCPTGVLSGFAAATNSQSNTSSWVFPADPSVGPIGSSITGPVALRIRSSGGFTLLGQVVPDSNVSLAWSVAEVPSQLAPGAVTVVHGWLGATSIEPPCVPSLTTSSVTGINGQPLDYGCGNTSFLTDTPVTAETTIADGAIRLQNGAYQGLDGPPPSPAADGRIQPREGTYLLRQVLASPDCPADPAGSSADPCAGPLVRLGEQWELIARLDPLSIPRDQATSAPSPTPTATSTEGPGPIWDPTQRPLTPPEFLRILGGHPAPGTVLIVDDQVMQSAIDCATNVECPTGALVNATGTLVEPNPGGTLTFPTNGSVVEPIPGPIALQVTDGPYLAFLGSVVGNGDRLAFKAHDLAARNAMGGLFVIPGWIVAGLQPACPAPAGTPTPGPTSELGFAEPDYGCAINNWLTDDEYQPDEVVDDGTSVKITMTPPADGLALQLGAYQEFAPYPADDGHNGTLPQQGVFLVHDWAGRGEVLARLDSIPIPTEAGQTPGIEGTPAPEITPTPTQAVESPDSPVGSVIWSKDALVNELVAGTIPDGNVVVTFLVESDLTPVVPPGTVRYCGLICSEWYLGPVGHRVTIVKSYLAPEPNAHTGRVAFLVQGGQLRLLGRVTTQPQGQPLDLSSVGANSDFMAVHGWLRSGPPVPCPSIPASEAILGLDQKPIGYGCMRTWLQPTGDDLASSAGDPLAPPGSFTVQDGAAGASPSTQEGTFLVRSLSCSNQTQGCAGLLAGQLDDLELIGELVGPDRG